MQPIKIVVVISDLGAGGAERVLSILANEWVLMGHQVHVFSFAHLQVEPYYPFDIKIKITQLGLPSNNAPLLQGVLKALIRIFVLRSALRWAAPDVVVAFLNKVSVLTLLASVRLPFPVIISERNNPERQPMARGWRLLRQWTYPHAAALVCQTRAILAALPVIPGLRTLVVPNPIPMPAHAAAPLEKRTIVGVGRLTHQKGFDLLIEAFSEIASDHPTWDLVIFGDGREKEHLISKRNALRLADRIHFPGITTRPGDWIDETGIFVLSSRFEGFPNVLGEAMAAGLPVIAFDCPFGPAEMVKPDTGILVPAENINQLSAAIDRLIRDRPLRSRLATAARASMCRFGKNYVMSLWEDLLESVSKKKHS